MYVDISIYYINREYKQGQVTSGYEQKERKVLVTWKSLAVP